MVKAVIFDFLRTLWDPDKNEFVPQARQILGKLKSDFSLGLVSTGEEGRQELIKRVGLDEIFDYIAVIPEKSEVQFLDFCKKINCKPRDVMVVGDRIRSEIAIANSLGMRSVWLKKGIFASELPRSSAEKPHFEIESLAEFVDIVYSKA